MKYSFSGRAALVTGAGSGIGEAIARLLASNGLSVVVSDVSADNAQRVTSLISTEAATPWRCGRRGASMVRLPWPARSITFGDLHFAVNNAGISGRVCVDAAWSRVIDQPQRRVMACHQIHKSSGGAIQRLLLRWWATQRTPRTSQPSIAYRADLQGNPDQSIHPGCVPPS